MSATSLKPVIEKLESLFSSFNQKFYNGELQTPVITVSPDTTKGAYKIIMYNVKNDLEYYTRPDAVRRLDEMGFFDAPASINHHGAYSGALFDHSLAVTGALLDYTDKMGLTWSDARSPYIVGMFHDLCKCDNYKVVDGKWKYNPNMILPGHGEKSIIMLQNIAPDALTNEEIACIRWHMGAFDDRNNWEYYTRAVAKFPNVMYTHAADMAAAYIVGV